LHPHDDGHEPQDAKVLGFMGAINGIIVDEENIPNWLIVEDDGTMGCKVCTCPVTTIADHEQENDHFQAQLLYDMEIYFSQLKLEQEAKSEEGNKENCEEGVSPKRKSDEVDDDGFVLVENKRKRTKRLKVKAGQR
jgi:3'-phosphoadenosine 5'-phosphosulfate sulfotransferase (PAPS reductase)/FAD synthetase